MGNRSGTALDRFIEELAERTPYDAATIRRSLSERVGRNNERLIETVRVLQEIRKTV